MFFRSHPSIGLARLFAAAMLALTLGSCEDSGNEGAKGGSVDPLQSDTGWVTSDEEARQTIGAGGKTVGSNPVVRLIPNVPGPKAPEYPISATGQQYADDPVAVEAGRQLYYALNCYGCHFNGGGGMGVPLIDDAWIYGDNIDQIAASIFEGRPNGMPSFRGVVPDEQIWQLAAFVHGWAQGAVPPQLRAADKAAAGGEEKKGDTRAVK